MQENAGCNRIELVARGFAVVEMIQGHVAAGGTIILRNANGTSEMLDARSLYKPKSPATPPATAMTPATC